MRRHHRDPAEARTHSVQVAARRIVAPADRMPVDLAREEATPADQVPGEVMPAGRVQAAATTLADPERAVAIGRERRIIARERAETTRTGPEQAETQIGLERAETTVQERERIIVPVALIMPIVLVARMRTIAAEQRAIIISRQVPGTLH
jgi:hypothetical protein